MTEPEPAPSIRLRLRRDGNDTAERANGWLRNAWSRRRWRWAMIAGGGLLLGAFLFWFIFARGLPDAGALLDYKPELPTTVRDINGEPIHSYARERRVQLQFSDFPPVLVNAYLAAEDKTFFTHHGVDFPGLAGAILDYVTKLGSGARAKGGSTITQQVAKNLLIGDEYSPTRKIKEMILAWRIENALTKQQILELYLNQIPLGRQSFGVQAASRAYFDKDVGQLALHEAAFLAILPKAPERYGRARNAAIAMTRRNLVLDQMVANDWATPEQAAAAKALPLGLIVQRVQAQDRSGGYYLEEVRRRLIAAFGETAQDGANSVYAGGLWVRTPLDPAKQQLTEKALRNGLLRYDAGKGWVGPIRTLDLGNDWVGALNASNIGIDFEDWRVAVVLDKASGVATIGMAGGVTGSLPASAAQQADRRIGQPAFNSLKRGDVIVVKPNGTSFVLRNVPGVSGGMLVQDVRTGRIMAMQGGFDVRLSSYNRATQAMRQPGSTIKPFVYAAALDNGMTPASIIVDGPFCVWQSATLGRKCFRNFEGGGAGPQTMRWGVEQSRNLMTVRAASQTGMSRVVRTIKAVGIGDYQPYLAFALGAGETTVEKMVNGFAVLANHGRDLSSRAVDYVQDREGKVIWPKDWRACQGCSAADWDGKPMPRFANEGRQVMNAMTAYQVVHISEGVITRGTATMLADLDRPLFGKTGTTTGPTNVWFIGGSPDIVAGVYLGYDQPRSLGGYAQGGRIAAPIWKEAMKPILETMPKRPFVAPPGMRLVRIDRRSGKRVFGGGWPASDPKSAIIWEAFKPETEPRRSIRTEEVAERDKGAAGPAVRRNDVPKDFATEQGGVY
jgi:penicillin-binding protein 1A